MYLFYSSQLSQWWIFHFYLEILVPNYSIKQKKQNCDLGMELRLTLPRLSLIIKAGATTNWKVKNWSVVVVISWKAITMVECLPLWEVQWKAWWSAYVLHHRQHEQAQIAQFFMKYGTVGVIWKINETSALLKLLFWNNGLQGQGRAQHEHVSIVRNAVTNVLSPDPWLKRCVPTNHI